MLYIKSFNNYDEFKNIFGVVEHGNGEKSRKNKILLEQYKNKELWKFCRENENWYPFTISDYATFKQWLTVMMSCVSFSGSHYNFLLLDKYRFCSKIYKVGDDMVKIDEPNKIRYERFDEHTQTLKRYNMKVGKFIGKLIEETPLKKIFCTQAQTWLRETIAEEWKAEVEKLKDRYTLYTGKTMGDFERIYSSEDTHGDFGSCMTDRGQHSFYVNAVDATAAWLEDEDGYMVARCVIFNDVRDREGNHYRLAERQYSEGGDLKLKRLLVNKLIEKNLIDGYKQIGAGCHDNCAFVSNKDESWSDKLFHIECNLQRGDTLSYQDSFVGYDNLAGLAYNDTEFSYCLNTTDSRFRCEDEYDSWHDYYCERVVDVWSNGVCYTCDEDNLDNFDYIEYLDEYHHRDECVWDENRNYHILRDDAVGSYRDDCCYHEDDAVYCEFENDYCLPQDAVYLPDLGVYVFEEHYYECEKCGKMFYMEDENEQCLCEQCKKELEAEKTA